MDGKRYYFRIYINACLIVVIFILSRPKIDKKIICRARKKQASFVDFRCKILIVKRKNMNSNRISSLVFEFYSHNIEFINFITCKFCNRGYEIDLFVCKWIFVSPFFPQGKLVKQWKLTEKTKQDLLMFVCDIPKGLFCFLTRKFGTEIF